MTNSSCTSMAALSTFQRCVQQGVRASRLSCTRRLESVRAEPAAAFARVRVRMCVAAASVRMVQISKALNEVWRTFEMAHKPAYALDLVLPPGTYDVNVTPDKRDIFLTHVR
ncbi:MAG: hypothetical protein EOO41_00580 [Methanobacteriota archaeon]|nr:MAG: hypothetical protein EOO41_00580 [Euryarchaeota archaeon]